MNIHELPHYHIENNSMHQRYAKSLRTSTQNLKFLSEHIDRWKAAWESWPRPTKVITRILKHSISERELNRLQEAVSNTESFIPNENDELVNELLVPVTFLMAVFVAQKFNVPFCTALHQGFCNLKDHSNCF